MRHSCAIKGLDSAAVADKRQLDARNCRLVQEV
jgi:hypothetical protein